MFNSLTFINSNILIPETDIKIPVYIILAVFLTIFIILTAILLILKKRSGKGYNFQKLDECIEALNDTREDMRVRACWSIAVHRNPAAEQSLLRLLYDESKFVRGAAASAIGSMKQETSIHSLETAIKEEKDSYTKAQMERAVKKIKEGEQLNYDLAESLDEKDSIQINLNSSFDRPIEIEDKKGKKSKKTKPLMILEDIELPKKEPEFLHPLSEKIEISKKEIVQKDGKELEVKFTIKAQTESAKKLLFHISNLNKEEVSFNINLDFNWKE